MDCLYLLGMPTRFEITEDFAALTWLQQYARIFGILVIGNLKQILLDREQITATFFVIIDVETIL